VTRQPGGQYAVKNVDAAQHALDQVLRGADAHQVARLVFGQDGIDHLNRAVHVGFALADRKPADGMPREAQTADHPRRFCAQILKNAALHDTKQGLVIPFFSIQAAVCPEVGAFHGFLGVVVVKGVRAFVESHNDIRPEVFLDRDRAFGGQAFHGAIDVGFESHPIGVDLARV